MAVVNRNTPDVFNKAVQGTAPGKSRVVNILNLVRTAGSSVVSLLTGLLAAALILYSGYVLYDSFYTQNTAVTGAWDLLQYKPEIIEEGAAPASGAGTLSDILSDYRAWLTLYDTNIDYAVMQGPDDLYYTSHDIYGQSSITGAIYLASANNGGFVDNYNLLYGHHMSNGSMFGSLDKFMDESYFDSHREGVLVAGSGVYDLTTFAVVLTNAYESQVYTVSNKSGADVINFLESSSPMIYRREVANSSSKILALSTCSSAITNGRLVVFAVMTPRNMSKTQNGVLTLRVARYEGVYDALEHSVSATVNLDGAVIEYSVDGGATWSKNPPVARYVDESTYVLVRASYPGMESVSAYCEIRILPRLAVVTAKDEIKAFGQPDPVFTAEVTGTVGDDKLDYTVSRPRSGVDEAIGLYDDTIIAEGEEVQLNGSYTVVYYPGDFTIVDKLDSMTDGPSPDSVLRPSGSSFGERCWALVNLICLLVTVYILLPLFHLRDKFGRGPLLKNIDEKDETTEDKIKRFRRRFRLGFGCEMVITLLALMTFILTENMCLPMVLIDKWTPLMVLFLALCLCVDILAVRLRDKELTEDPDL